MTTMNLRQTSIHSETWNKWVFHQADWFLLQDSVLFILQSWLQSIKKDKECRPPKHKEHHRRPPTKAAYFCWGTINDDLQHWVVICTQAYKDVHTEKELRSHFWKGHSTPPPLSHFWAATSHARHGKHLRAWSLPDPRSLKSPLQVMYRSKMFIPSLICLLAREADQDMVGVLVKIVLLFTVQKQGNTVCRESPSEESVPGM